jgi:hypothetical protein
VEGERAVAINRSSGLDTLHAVIWFVATEDCPVNAGEKKEPLWPE